MPQKNVTCIDTFQSINNELAARFYFCHMVYINNNILLPQIKSLKGDFFLLTQTSFGVPTPNPSLDDGTRWWGKKKSLMFVWESSQTNYNTSFLLQMTRYCSQEEQCLSNAIHYFPSFAQVVMFDHVLLRHEGKTLLC